MNTYKQLILITILILFSLNKSFCQIQIVDSNQAIKDGRYYVELKLISKNSFESDLNNIFHEDLQSIDYLGCEIFVNKKGIPIRIEFMGRIGKIQNEKFKNICKKIKKHVLKYYKWSWVVPKNSTNKNYVFDNSIFYVIKDF